MKQGTKSVLFGYHAFWIHGFFVLRAWTILYGFPKRWWELLAIFVHDFGYFGLSTMDGYDGKRHPLYTVQLFNWIQKQGFKYEVLRHSRSYNKINPTILGQMSRLGYADKLAFALYPSWLLWILYFLSNEHEEYVHHFYNTHYLRDYSFGSANYIGINTIWYRWALHDSIDAVTDLFDLPEELVLSLERKQEYAKALFDNEHGKY